MEPDLAERESALRSLEGRNPRRELLDERNSDEADLFLQVAQEEDDLNRQKNLPALSRLDSKKVIIFLSLPILAISSCIRIVPMAGLRCLTGQ